MSSSFLRPLCTCPNFKGDLEQFLESWTLGLGGWVTLYLGQYFFLSIPCETHTCISSLITCQCTNRICDDHTCLNYQYQHFVKIADFLLRNFKNFEILTAYKYLSYSAMSSSLKLKCSAMNCYVLKFLNTDVKLKTPNLKNYHVLTVL